MKFLKILGLSIIYTFLSTISTYLSVKILQLLGLL